MRSGHTPLVKAKSRGLNSIVAGYPQERCVQPRLPDQYNSVQAIGGGTPTKKSTARQADIDMHTDIKIHDGTMAVRSTAPAATAAPTTSIAGRHHGWFGDMRRDVIV